MIPTACVPSSNAGGCPLDKIAQYQVPRTCDGGVLHTFPDGGVDLFHCADGSDPAYCGSAGVHLDEWKRVPCGDICTYSPSGQRYAKSGGALKGCLPLARLESDSKSLVPCSTAPLGCAGRHAVRCTWETPKPSENDTSRPSWGTIH